MDDRDDLLSGDAFIGKRRIEFVQGGLAVGLGELRAIGHQEFSSASLEAYINARVLIDGLRRVGKDPAPIRLRAALASIRNFDLGGFVVDYGGQPPFVGSRYIDLGVLGNSGRFVG